MTDNETTDRMADLGRALQVSCRRAAAAFAELTDAWNKALKAERRTDADRAYRWVTGKNR